MEYNKKLFWKVTLALFIILSASTFFFLVAQLQRHLIFVIQPQSVHTNIGVALLCIGSAFVLYYILNRDEFFWFFARREAAIRTINSIPEKRKDYQKLHTSTATGLPASQIPSRQELAKKGNL